MCKGPEAENILALETFTQQIFTQYRCVPSKLLGTGNTTMNENKISIQIINLLELMFKYILTHPFTL